VKSIVLIATSSKKQGGYKQSARHRRRLRQAFHEHLTSPNYKNTEKISRGKIQKSWPGNQGPERAVTDFGFIKPELATVCSVIFGPPRRPEPQLQRIIRLERVSAAEAICE
jgi:hypothetical protein